MSNLNVAGGTKKLFIPITKVDAVNGIVYGVLASETPDRSGEVFDYDGSKPHFEKWSNDIEKATSGKSLGNLRAMHGATAAGKFTQMVFNDDDKQIEVAAKVVDANELLKVQEGVYTGFSIGGKYEKRWKDGDLQRYIAIPHEGSLVDLPCIPDATFEVTKASGSELRKFHVPAAPAKAEVKDPTNDEVVAMARDLAKAAGDETKWLDKVTDARAALKATPAADLEPQHVLKLAVTAIDDAPSAGDDELGALQKWTHPELPDQTFDKKGDLRAALVAKRAEATAAALAAPATAALAEVTAALDARDPARKNASDNPDFAGKPDGKSDGKGKKPDPKAPAAKPDDKKKAKEEADKSKPMKSAADVMARALVVAAAAVPSFVERRDVIKAARDLDCVAVLPAGFIDPVDNSLAKVAMTDALAKAATLDSVSSLISLVSSLESFHSRLCSGDAPYYYSDAITKIDVSPETMAAVSAAVDSLGGIAASLLDEVLSAMKTEDAEKAVGRGRALGDLQKAGARNSKLDSGRLKKAHDLLVEVHPEMCGHDDDASKGADGDLRKQMTANNDAFTKTITDMAETMKGMAKQISEIAAQPVNGRPSSVNVVEKFGNGTDVLGATNESRAANERAFIEITADRTRFDLPNGR